MTKSSFCGIVRIPILLLILLLLLLLLFLLVVVVVGLGNWLLGLR